MPQSAGAPKGNKGLTCGLSGASLPVMPEGARIVGAPPAPVPLPFPPALLIPPIPTTLLRAQETRLSALHITKCKELCKAYNLQYVGNAASS